MTHTFNLDHTSVRLIVSHNGKVHKKSTGITLDKRLWNQKAKKLSAKCKDADAYKKLAQIDARLSEREQTAQTDTDVLNAIEYGLYGDDARLIAEKKGRPTFWEHFKEWSERDMPSRRYRQLAYRKVAEIMGTDDDWEDVDASYYHRFIMRMNDAGYSNNYKSTISSKIRSVLYEGRRLGYHKSDAYKEFKYVYETADTIALTEDEVERIWNADLKTDTWRRARDLFILGVYTASRFQNYSKLSEDNIIGNNIQFVQPKTGQSVIIPCSPKVRTILRRWDGKAPVLTEQEIGRSIKDICRYLGGSFLDTYEIVQSHGTRKVIEKKEKWQLVTTHTARRTGATLLYITYKVPIRQCMMLTGHATETNFRKYIRITKEQNARLLADNPFFQ